MESAWTTTKSLAIVRERPLQCNNCGMAKEDSKGLPIRSGVFNIGDATLKFIGLDYVTIGDDFVDEYGIEGHCIGNNSWSKFSITRPKETTAMVSYFTVEPYCRPLPMDHGYELKILPSGQNEFVVKKGEEKNAKYYLIDSERSHVEFYAKIFVNDKICSSWSLVFSTVNDGRVVARTFLPLRFETQLRLASLRHFNYQLAQIHALEAEKNKLVCGFWARHNAQNARKDSSSKRQIEKPEDEIKVLLVQPNKKFRTDPYQDSLPSTSTQSLNPIVEPAKNRRMPPSLLRNSGKRISDVPSELQAHSEKLYSELNKNSGKMIDRGTDTLAKVVESTILESQHPDCHMTPVAHKSTQTDWINPNDPFIGGEPVPEREDSVVDHSIQPNMDLVLNSHISLEPPTVGMDVLDTYYDPISPFDFSSEIATAENRLGNTDGHVCPVQVETAQEFPTYDELMGLNQPAATQADKPENIVETSSETFHQI